MLDGLTGNRGEMAVDRIVDLCRDLAFIWLTKGNHREFFMNKGKKLQGKSWMN